MMVKQEYTSGVADAERTQWEHRYQTVQVRTAPEGIYYMSNRVTYETLRVQAPLFVGPNNMYQVGCVCSL
jgi:hypothetical protein